MNRTPHFHFTGFQVKELRHCFFIHEESMIIVYKDLREIHLSPKLYWWLKWDIMPVEEILKRAYRAWIFEETLIKPFSSIMPDRKALRYMPQMDVKIKHKGNIVQFDTMQA